MRFETGQYYFSGDDFQAVASSSNAASLAFGALLRHAKWSHEADPSAVRTIDNELHLAASFARRVVDHQNLSTVKGFGARCKEVTNFVLAMLEYEQLTLHFEEFDENSTTGLLTDGLLYSKSKTLA